MSNFFPSSALGRNLSNCESTCPLPPAHFKKGFAFIIDGRFSFFAISLFFHLQRYELIFTIQNEKSFLCNLFPLLLHSCIAYFRVCRGVRLLTLQFSQIPVQHHVLSPNLIYKVLYSLNIVCHKYRLIDKNSDVVTFGASCTGLNKLAEGLDGIFGRYQAIDGFHNILMGNGNLPDTGV